MVVLERRDRKGVVAAVGVPLSMRTPALLAVYAFRGMEGAPAVGDRIPDAAPSLDAVPAVAIGDDGLLRMLLDDGSTVVAGRARGADALMPATAGGTTVTDKDGKAKLDWSALKLKAPPSWVDVAFVGKPYAWAFETAPTATGATVLVTAPSKTGSLVSLTVKIGDDLPVVGAPLNWRAWA